MQVKQQLLQLKPYQPGKPIEEVKKELGLNHVIKLASNENPFRYSDKVKEALQAELDQLPIYPDGYAASLRTAVANHIGVKETEIIFGNGSDEVIQILSRALLSPEKNTVMATHTFSQYRHNAVIEGADVREVPVKNGEHDLDGMLEAIDDQTAIVWLCNPNNPTGHYINHERFLSFLNQVPEHVLVVSDEAYYEYVIADDFPETLSLIDRYPNLMVLRTFSKAYGLAALRIGYGVANEAFIQKIEPAREPFNTSRLAQVAAQAALSDQDFIASCRKQNRDGMMKLQAFCDEHGLSYYPSQTNFLLVDMKRNGDDVFQYLLKNGYIVRSGNALGFPTSVRITIGSDEEMDGLIAVLREMLQAVDAVDEA